jgi:glycerol-1-phosphate dehydrogenase [NAD(P)+]
MNEPLTPENEKLLLEKALAAASDTRVLLAEPKARHRAAEVFASVFGGGRVLVVADENTFEAAGRDVRDAFVRAGAEIAEPFVFPRGIHADHALVDELEAAIRREKAVPVAVGSGTVNDLAKLASHRAGRSYMTVATAASVDGYTAFGASITRAGLKQTFDCPAPRAVLADMETIARAPAGMNASGYADLLAKSAAGADWILADAADEEKIVPPVRDMVQGSLRSWLSSPGGIARGEPEQLRGLVYGLMIVGFAMQAMKSSRPAAGAEHQFSHLWDMQNHMYKGETPSHGFKVGIGTLASTALYEHLLGLDADSLDIDAALRRAPSPEDVEREAAAAFDAGDLREAALRETRAKRVDGPRLREQLVRLRGGWEKTRACLRGHLIGFDEARDMLRGAGCPCGPEAIGISRERLRRSFTQARLIRRRYTCLDFAERWGLTESALDGIFGPGGLWVM